MGLALMWTTDRATGLDSMAHPLYVFISVTLLVFVLLVSPKLLNMKDKLAVTFATTTLSVVSWSFVRGSRQAATDQALALIIGTTIGIVMSFVIGCCLFPVSCTWSYLTALRKVMGSLNSQLHHSLRLLRHSHQISAAGVSSRSSNTSSDSSIEEGSLAVSLELRAMHRSDRHLWSLLQKGGALMEKLDTSQNECYVRLVGGGYTVVPCWPFRGLNSISQPHFRLVHRSVRDLARTASLLGNRIRLGLTQEMLSELEANRYPVGAIPHIADLIEASMQELRDKVPSYMRPGSARLPSDQHIVMLQREVLELLSSEAEVRDRQYAQVLDGGEAARRRLASLDNHMLGFSFLDSLQSINGCLIRLHLCLSSAIIHLPWFQDPSLTAVDLATLKHSITEVLDEVLALSNSGVGELQILETYFRRRAATLPKPGTAPAGPGGGFGAL